MDKQNAKQVRKAVESALAVVGQELGISFDLGNITYYASGFRASIKGEVINKSEYVKATESHSNYIQSRRMGFEEDVIGKFFSYNGDVYRIDSFSPRSKRYPIIATKIGGDRQYKMSPRAVVNNIIKSKTEK